MLIFYSNNLDFFYWFLEKFGFDISNKAVGSGWFARSVSAAGMRSGEKKLVDCIAMISRPTIYSQEECLQRLRSRIDIAYDNSVPEHQEAFRALWNAAFLDQEWNGLESERWEEMGWPGKDPSTDFRGCSFISLENMLFFSANFPTSFKDLQWKREGDRSAWEYPFAVAGLYITFMLIQMLDLEAVKPRTLVGVIFLKFLSENDAAFDLLYCIAFKLMDHKWLAMRASCMDFITVRDATRIQLEGELPMEGITHLEDLPSYKLLKR